MRCENSPSECTHSIENTESSCMTGKKMAVVIESEESATRGELKANKSNFTVKLRLCRKISTFADTRVRGQPSLEFHLCFIRVLSRTRCNVVPRRITSVVKDPSLREETRRKEDSEIAPWYFPLLRETAVYPPIFPAISRLR